MFQESGHEPIKQKDTTAYIKFSTRNVGTYFLGRLRL